MHDAIGRAGRSQLRAVLLTSVTTVAGLLPLLSETSMQAQFLIPAALFPRLTASCSPRVLR